MACCKIRPINLCTQSSFPGLFSQNGQGVIFRNKNGAIMKEAIYLDVAVTYL